MFAGLIVDEGLHGNILYLIYYILRSALVCNNMFAGLLVDKGLHGNILYEAPIVRVCNFISLTFSFSLSKNIDFIVKKYLFLCTNFFNFTAHGITYHRFKSKPPILILMNIKLWNCDLRFESGVDIYKISAFSVFIGEINKKKFKGFSFL